MARVLLLSGGADTGGQGIRVKTMLDRYPEHGWQARSVVASQTYLGYPVDIEFEKVGWKGVVALYEESDLIHVRNDFGIYDLTERRRRGKPKPVVIHHHGTMYRKAPEALNRESATRRAVAVCSTLDLSVLGTPEDPVEWLPIPMDVPALAAYRAPRNDGKVRVYHSPTNRTVKDTELFLAVMRRLEARHPQVETVLRERIRWEQNLTEKGAADIVYDQLVLGWGNNALEAWAMGIPVVGGVKYGVVRDKMAATVGELPFTMAGPDTLEDVLEMLILDAGCREREGQRGKRFVEEFHAESAVAPRLARVYERALERAA